MRITNALITRDTIARLMTNSAKLAEAQDRVATGLKVKTMSDDPTAGSGIMQASSALRAIAQYRTNVQHVKSELDAEDSAIGQITLLLERAKELAVAQSGANTSGTSRAAAAEEMRQLLAQAVTLGNTQVGGVYLFGGANSSTSAPFDATQTGAAPLYVADPSGSGSPVPPQGTRAVEIAAGQTMRGAHDGDTVFVQTGVFRAMHELTVALAANDGAAIAASAYGIDSAHGGLQSLVGDVGARRNRVDVVEASLDAYESNMSSMKSGLSEVDMEAAITEMVARQTAYQAAMLASSKVMGLSLTEYLR
jgi:flagellar hook-associated protein 3 FlgL